jgi:hypothetical protein
MKRSSLLVLAAVAVVWIRIGVGDAAEQDRKIPLGSVYTTTGQKDAKDAAAEFRDEAQPYGVCSGLPRVFLVNGNDFRAAVKASRPFLEDADDGKKPAPKTESKAGGPHWVGACLGSDGSLPPAFRVLSVEISGTTIRVTYESIQRNESTNDEHPYLLWAPLGNLTAGEYTLELYDTTAKKVTVSRKSKVVE